jgi:BirA family transcriptional regulator, biotin operon repressor / biotin---[acetyl-CoA-carboxylase] ligase
MSDWQIESLASCDSTNRLLLTRDGAHRQAITADFQTAGRGQRGRAWHAPAGSCLLLSAAWTFPINTPLTGLSLLVGLSLKRALSQLGLDEPRLKWPNDVLARDKKLAGILVECRNQTAVIGIGLNHHLPPASFTHEPNAIDLAQLSPAALPDLNTCRDAILQQLDLDLAHFAQAGFAAFAAEWNAAHAYAGQSVTAFLPDGSHLVGEAQGVTAQGELQLNVNGASHRLHSATLRKTAT